MKKHVVIQSLDNIYQRFKCQGFVPERDRDELCRAVDEYITEGGRLDVDITDQAIFVLNTLIGDIIYVKEDKDRQHYIQIHELVSGCLVKISKSPVTEGFG